MLLNSYRLSRKSILTYSLIERILVPNTHKIEFSLISLFDFLDKIIHNKIKRSKENMGKEVDSKSFENNVREYSDLCGNIGQKITKKIIFIQHFMAIVLIFQKIKENSGVIWRQIIFKVKLGNSEINLGNFYNLLTTYIDLGCKNIQYRLRRYILPNYFIFVVF